LVKKMVIFGHVHQEGKIPNFSSYFRLPIDY
jgi:hypothetical protein